MSTRTPLPTVNERDTENVSAVIQRHRCDTGCGSGIIMTGDLAILRTDQCRFMTAIFEAIMLQNDSTSGHLCVPVGCFFSQDGNKTRDPE